ncbi:MAG: alpha/beta fold hydrolase [Actinobacteria bacterium]|nr:alpha/beta fold hydrolase [Actinomycetota bacterium]
MPGVAYDVRGSGEPVLLIAPAATRSQVWQLHQVPALVAAGYQAVTYDHRGTPPSPAPGPAGLADLVADAAVLIASLGLAPCRVVGASLGALVAQELAGTRPDLVRAAVLMGTRYRTDFYRTVLAHAMAGAVRDGESEGAPDVEAVWAMSRLFSAATLADDRAAADWYSVLRASPLRGAAAAAQYEAAIIPDRSAVLRTIRQPCLVIGFAEDVITPPGQCRDVAAVIPGARYVEISDCGHFGFLEQPETVNAVINEFFRAGR